ncbi:MAG: hypothetical protein K2Y15_10635 [Burkholderiaceae bacterium]|nr:hypothetical protein [Burkholderiaceae bacterium]
MNLEFKIDFDQVFKVATALGSRDVSDCLVPDVKHTCEVLARILILQDLAPGFLDELFAIFIPHFIKSHAKSEVAAFAQKKADEAGFGTEWRELIEAGNSQGRKDFVARMVALRMKVNAVSQADAIRITAKQLRLEEDSVKKSVTRAKKRKG